MQRKVKSLILSVILLGFISLFMPKASALDIPTLTWERGVHQQITLGGNNGGGAWKLYLVGTKDTILEFSPSKIKNSNFYQYRLALPNNLPLGNYEIMVSQVSSGSVLAVIDRKIVGHVKVINPTAYNFMKDKKFGWLVGGLLALLIQLSFRFTSPIGGIIKTHGLALHKNAAFVGFALGIGAGAFTIRQSELISSIIWLPLVGILIAFMNFRIALHASLGYMLVEFAFGRISTFQQAAGVFTFALSWLVPVLLCGIQNHYSQEVIPLRTSRKLFLRILPLISLTAGAIPLLYGAVLGERPRPALISFWSISSLIFAFVWIGIIKNYPKAQIFELGYRRFSSSNLHAITHALFSGFALYVLTHSILGWISLSSLVFLIAKLPPRMKLKSDLVSPYRLETFIMVSFAVGIVEVWLVNISNLGTNFASMIVALFTPTALVIEKVTEKEEAVP